MDSSFQFIGNLHAQQEINQWFTHFQPSAKLSSASCLVVSGPNGIGKTTLMRYLCAQHQFLIHWITPDNCDSGKSLQDMLKKFTQSTIDDAWGKDHTQSIIVIDGLDILMSNDRNLFLILHQLITKNTTIPDKAIVLITEPSILKKLQDSKLSQLIVRMKSISVSDLCVYMKHTFPELNASTIMKLVDACDGNLVHARELASFERGNHTESLHSIANEIQTLSVSSSKNESNEKQPDMNELYVQKSIPSWMKLFLLEPWMHPLRFHENFLKEMENSRKLKAEKCHIYMDLLSYLIEWDTYMGFLLENNMEASMVELPLEQFCLNIHTLIDRLKRQYPLKHSNESLTEFTKLLSQLSLQKKYCQQFFETYNGDSYPIHELPYHWFHTDISSS